MCGLVGVAGNSLFAKEKKVFHNLLLVNSLRGLHGAGVAALYGSKKELWYQVKKTEDPSSIWVYQKSFDDVIKNAQMRVLMGHSRFATQGKIEKRNNHPFEVGEGSETDVIGMHNGTINGQFKRRKDFDTDSEALFNLIYEVGLKEALKELYSKSYNPAYALSILDLREDSVTLIRNKERPLFLAKALDTHFWASDKSFLEFAFNYNGVTNYEIESIDPGTLVKLFPMELDAKKRIVVTPKYFEAPESRVIYTSHFRGVGPQTRRFPHDEIPFDKKGKEKTETKTKTGGDSSRTSLTRYFLIGNHLLHINALDKILADGCAICGAPETADKVRFSKDSLHEFYCQECKEPLEELYHMSWDDQREVKPADATDM